MNERFADQVHNIWLVWSLWTVSSQPNVHGVFGPDVDGEKPFTGLASGHPVTGLWVDGGGA